jgi:sulfate-transporting ATPase
VITATDLEVRAGARTLLSTDGAALRVQPGDRIGLVGRNGAGKTTSMRVLAGEGQPQAGRLEVKGPVGYLPQDPRTGDLSVTARDRVLSARGLDTLVHEIAKIQIQLSETPDDERLVRRYGNLEDRFSAMGGYAAESEAARICANLSLPDRVLGQELNTLSGGQRRRVELARILFADSAGEPTTMLLDEPTNHLDAESVEWLEQFLLRFPGTVIAVTHDRYFLDNAAEWILELDRGYGIPWKGNYSSWLEQKEQRLEIEAKQESARIKAMQKELEWVRTNPKGRQAKAKARIARFEELSSHEHQKRNETQEIFIPVAERLGGQVIELHGVSKGYGERLLIDDLSFSVPPGAIVGIIGPNGAGKTTLFRMITGAEKPDKGKIVIGSTAKLAVVDQSREALPDGKTAWEAISGGHDILTVGKFEMPSRAYLGRFNFKGVDQQKMVGALSGGERGRLHLALTLLKGGNVLLLDEPSNDLDVETLRALEDALLEFAGSVLVISHDRWFLDRIATHILAFEGDSRAVFFEGNYQEYEADKKKRLGEEGARPHRIRYKALMA